MAAAGDAMDPRRIVRGFSDSTQLIDNRGVEDAISCIIAPQHEFFAVQRRKFM